MKDSIRPETMLMLPFVQRWNGRLTPVCSPFRVQASSQGTNAGMKMQSSIASRTLGDRTVFHLPPPFLACTTSRHHRGTSMCIPCSKLLRLLPLLVIACCSLNRCSCWASAGTLPIRRSFSITRALRVRVARCDTTSKCVVCGVRAPKTQRHSTWECFKIDEGNRGFCSRSHLDSTTLLECIRDTLCCSVSQGVRERSASPRTPCQELMEHNADLKTLSGVPKR